MARRFDNLVRLTGPFGGLDLSRPSRSIDPHDAINAHNVITSHGTVDLRDPVELWGTYPASSVGWLPGIAGELLSFTTQRNNQSWPCLAVWYGNSDLGKMTTLIYEPNGVVQVAGHGVYFRTCPVFANDVLYLVRLNDQTYSEKLYVGSSTGEPWHLYPIGLPKPDAPSVGKGQEGSLPPGIYRYRLTYYNSELQQEGQTSGYGQIVLAAPYDECVLVWDNPVPLDAQVDKVRIYRMLIGTDAAFYRLTEVAVGAEQFWDHGDLVFPKIEQDMLKVGVLAPPASRTAVWHMNRMWYVPTALPGSIIHSEFEAPQLVNPTKSYATGGNVWDGINAAYSIGTTLLLFKLDELWAITGDSEDTFVCEKIATGIGAFGSPSRSPRPCQTDEALYWVHARGIFEWRNGAVRLVSAPIAPLWAQLAPNDLIRTSLGWDQYHNVVILYTPVNPPGLLAYHPSTGKWTTWMIPSFAVGTHRGGVLGGNPPSVQLDSMNMPYFVHYPSGNVLRLNHAPDVWKDLGTDPIGWSWKTGDMTFGTQRRKKYYFARAAWKRGLEGNPITVKAAFSETEDASVSATGTLHSSPPDVILPLAGVSDTVRIELSAPTGSQDQVRITEIEIDAEPIGAR